METICYSSQSGSVQYYCQLNYTKSQVSSWSRIVSKLSGISDKKASVLKPIRFPAASELLRQWWTSQRHFQNLVRFAWFRYGTTVAQNPKDEFSAESCERWQAFSFRKTNSVGPDSFPGWTIKVYTLYCWPVSTFRLFQFRRGICANYNTTWKKTMGDEPKHWQRDSPLLRPWYHEADLKYPKDFSPMTRSIGSFEDCGYEAEMGKSSIDHLNLIDF